MIAGLARVLGQALLQLVVADLHRIQGLALAVFPPKNGRCGGGMRNQEIGRLHVADDHESRNAESSFVGLVAAAFVLALGPEANGNARGIGLVDIGPLLAVGGVHLEFRRPVESGRVGDTEALDLVGECFRGKNQQAQETQAGINTTVHRTPSLMWTYL